MQSYIKDLSCMSKKGKPKYLLLIFGNTNNKKVSPTSLIL